MNPPFHKNMMVPSLKSNGILRRLFLTADVSGPLGVPSKDGTTYRANPQPSTYSGYTLIELLVAMALASTLIGFVTINLLGVQRKTNIAGAEEMIISEMRSQQAKAMNGIDGPASYGIHIDSDKYTLFKGSSYNPSDPKNSPVGVDGAALSTNFQNGDIVFAALSGEVSYSGTNNQITVQDASGSKTETITVNKFGSVVNIQ